MRKVREFRFKRKFVHGVRPYRAPFVFHGPVFMVSGRRKKR